MSQRRARDEHSGSVGLAAALVLLALAGVAAGCGAPAISKQRTNVLLIVVDTLRADHLSAWGYGAPTSPEIDALASQGVDDMNSLPQHLPRARPATGRL